jgi:hypothetical protein
VSSISRSHRQGSTGSGVKDQPERCQTSGDAGLTSITRNTTSDRAPGRIRTSGPRIRSPPLCPLSYRRPWMFSQADGSLRVADLSGCSCYPAVAVDQACACGRLFLSRVGTSVGSVHRRTLQRSDEPVQPGERDGAPVNPTQPIGVVRREPGRTARVSTAAPSAAWSALAVLESIRNAWFVPGVGHRDPPDSLDPVQHRTGREVRAMGESASIGKVTYLLPRRQPTSKYRALGIGRSVRRRSRTP